MFVPTNNDKYLHPSNKYIWNHVDTMVGIFGRNSNPTGINIIPYKQLPDIGSNYFIFDLLISEHDVLVIYK